MSPRTSWPENRGRNSSAKKKRFMNMIRLARLMIVAIVLVVLLVIVLRFALVVVPKDHAYVIERMGQYVGTFNPGLHYVMPLMDAVRFKYPTSVQVQELSDVAETRDHQPVNLARTYRFRVIDPQRASYGTGDYASSLR